MVLADRPELIGFFSYSREDDADSHGALSALRGSIQGELRGLLGRTTKTFRLWQDKEAIPSGTLWETEITNAAAQSVFFIPIITPTVVASRYCRFELDAFLAREAALGRSDLVFPILYIDVPALEDGVERDNDPVLSLVAKRQFVDWREFRYLDVHSTEFKREVGRFCKDIRDALRRRWVSPEERAATVERATAQDADAKRQEEEARPAAEVQARERQEEEQRHREAVFEQSRKAQTESKRRKDEEVQRNRELELGRKADAVPRKAEEQSLREEAKTHRTAQEEQRRMSQPPDGQTTWRRPSGLVVIGSLIVAAIVVAIALWPKILPLQQSGTVPLQQSGTAPLQQSGTAPLRQSGTVPLQQLRFDGTYRRTGNNLYDHLRFYPNGTVVNFWQRFNESKPTETSSPEDGPSSTYETTGDRIKFSEPYKDVSIDYAGTIGVDSLNLEIFSHINNNRSNQTYQFIPWSAQSGK
jgi:hypothetical protein